MNIDLTCITLIRPSKARWVSDPRREERWKDFRFYGKEGKRTVGYVNLSINVRGEPNSAFWFNMNVQPPTRRPVVVYQHTEQPFWGQGVSGKLIQLANEYAQERWGETLGSDTLFVKNQVHDAQEKGYSLRPAQRVWEKLEAEGHALFQPFITKNSKMETVSLPRWIMK